MYYNQTNASAFKLYFYEKFTKGETICERTLNTKSWICFCRFFVYFRDVRILLSLYSLQPTELALSRFLKESWSRCQIIVVGILYFGKDMAQHSKFCWFHNWALKPQSVKPCSLRNNPKWHSFIHYPRTM